MVHSLESRELTDFIFFVNSIVAEVNLVNPKYPNAKVIIELLARSEPITGLFPTSLLCDNEKKALVQLSLGSPIELCILFGIIDKIYTFRLLLNSLSEVDEQLTTAFTLHPLLAGLLRAILSKIEELNNYREGRKIVEAATYDNFIQYFPGITRRYR